MNKKIFFAIPQLVGGGAERVVSVWTNELKRRGYNVSILIFARSQNENFISLDVEIHALADDIETYKQMSFINRFRTIRRCLKENRPNYIISLLPAMQVWMMFASLGLRIKRIETIRNNPWRISITNPIFKFLWHLCYKTCHRLILQTKDQGTFFSKKELKKSIVIPNPISPIYIQNYKQTIKNPMTKFITAERIIPQKNYKMMLEAFAAVARENPFLSLHIFGTGQEEYVAEIKRYTCELNIEKQVFFMGWSSHMEEEYQKNDVFLMTSDFEGMPNALAEAMASQLICISTDCKTGPRDLIDNGVNGYLVPVGNAEALISAIKQVLAMPYEKRAKMATAAREKILTYCSLEKSTDKLCTLFKE